VDAQTWDQLVVLHSRVEQELAKALHREHSLGVSDYRALHRLDAAPGGELRMQDLAVLIGLTQSSVTRLVARLEGGGLTRRDLCPDDRRGVYCVLTDRGRERLAEAEPTYGATLRRVFEQAAAHPLLADAVERLTG